jgi:hypothetical protein
MFPKITPKFNLLPIQPSNEKKNFHVHTVKRVKLFAQRSESVMAVALRSLIDSVTLYSLTALTALILTPNTHHNEITHKVSPNS